MDDSPTQAPSTTKLGAAGGLAGFAVAGGALGAFEALFPRAGGSSATVVLFAAGLGAAAAVPLGLGAVAVTALTSPRMPLLGTTATRARRWFERSSPSPPEDPFAATARRLADLGLVGLAVLGASVGLPMLFDLQEQAVGKALAIVFVALTVAGSLFVRSLAASLIARAVRAAQQRVRWLLPLPTWATWGIFVLLPLLFIVYPIYRKYGALLGVVGDALALVVLTALGIEMWLLLATLRKQARRFTEVAILFLALAGATTVGVRAKASPASFAAAERNGTVSLGGRVARFVTDVDLDGSSSLFGGKDCAPFDPGRGPGQPEIAQNGIDEDCNGSDSITSGLLGDVERFSDALGKKQIRRYNVVWVVMETVRADHVSAISYDRPTTPYLEKLAKESLLFTRAYSQSSATVLSLPSMLSGVDPGVASWTRSRVHPQLATQELTLAERLKAEGYETALVLDNYLEQYFIGMRQGFDDVRRAEPDAEKVSNRPRRNLLALASATDYLARTDPREAFFMVVYYPDQHGPYTRHPDVDSSAFAKGDIGDYDTELLFADQSLQALVEVMRARPKLWNNTILIVTADHGEEFGEHGGTSHAKTCFEESVHVPLLVRIPGIAAQRIDTRVALVDVVPTVLELVGARDEPERLSGQSLLLPALRPERVDPNRPIFCNIASITSKYGTFFRRAVRRGKYTFIEDVVAGTTALFDQESDPGELVNLDGREEVAGTADELRGLLEASLTGNLREHTKMMDANVNAAGDPRDER